MLFKRFSQASPRTHIQYGGSGLGLFVSRELTELQGGEIGVQSEPGQGSTFAFYIKAKRTSEPSGTALADLSLKRSRTNDRPSISDLSVLIVEDNLINQAILAKQLKQQGSKTHTANHGLEALKFLEVTKFWNGKSSHAESAAPTPKDLSMILLDIEMPVMDGLTCVQEIRRLEREGLIKGHIPIIAVSANARSEQIAKAKAAGMVSKKSFHCTTSAMSLSDRIVC